MAALSCLAARRITGVWPMTLLVLSTYPKASRSFWKISWRMGSPPSSSISRTRGMRVLLCSSGPAREERADARHRVGGLEGLGDEVVGAERGGPDAVGVAGARGEHDHGQPRRRRRLAETAQGLEAVGLRHDHVQDDQVGGGLRQPRQRRPSAAHPGGGEDRGGGEYGE